MKLHWNRAARTVRAFSQASCVALAGAGASTAGQIEATEPESRRRKDEREASARDSSFESFRRGAAQQLEHLSRCFETQSFAIERIEALVAAAVVCDALAPALSAESSEALDAWRRDTSSAHAPPASGPEAFARELARWAAAFDAESRPSLELAIVHAELGEHADARHETTVRVAARGRGGDVALQHDALWTCAWEDRGPRHAPLLAELRVRELAAVRSRPSFVDCAPAVFDADGVYARQLAPGLAHWQARLDASLGVSFLGHQGLALGDVDGDGFEDVYVCQPGGLPNLLFLRQPDGTAREAGAAAGLDFLDPTASALFLDLDGDRDLDLAATIGEDLLFFSNDGAGRFAPRGSFQAHTTMSLAAADVDGDADLDIYLCVYVSPYSDETTPIPYHDANNGAANRMLLNEGGFRFRNATAELGLDANNRRFSLAAAFEDYDDDGDQDLYVANDFGRNNLYRNDGGRFVDVAEAAGVEDVAASMGVSFGDYDRDGRIDLYVANMDSPAGRLRARQPLFQPRAGAEERDLFLRHARGNTLFRNAGRGRFEDVTLDQGVAEGRWAWGAIFVDLQNDGRLDLFVPNGMATNERADDLEERFWTDVVARSPLVADGAESEAREGYVEAWHEVNSLMRQGFSWNGNERNTAFVQLGGRFEDASFALGLDHADDARAAARIDWDQDGDLDLLVTNRTAPRLRLLRNDTSASNDFVAFRLIGSGANTAAIGARVELVAEGGTPGRNVTSVRAGEGFLAQQSAWIHFGLGGARPREVRVRWPDGRNERFGGIERGERYVLAQESGRALRFEAPRAALAASPVDPRAPIGAAPIRVVLAAPVPVPTLAIEDAAGASASLLGVGSAGEAPSMPARALLVWSAAETAGVQLLAELEARRADFAAAGIELFALCAETEGERAHSLAALERAGWSSRAAFATAEAVAVLDVLHGALLDRETPLPLPSVFLFDESARAVAMYLGGVEVAALLADRELVELDLEGRRIAASPFAGRWHALVSAAPLGYFRARFERRGLARAAREYMLGAIQVVRTRPADAEVELARHLARAGRHEEAAQAFRRAAASNVEHFDAHSGLGTVLHELRRYDEATSSYREALRIDPSHAGTWLNVGLVSLARGDREAAVHAAERLAALDSELIQKLEHAIATFDARATKR